MTQQDRSAGPAERTARIDLAAVRHNVAAVRARTVRQDGTRPLLTAVVKADGYGHGAVAVARAAQAAGADRLGVAHVREALELRGAGLRLPILAWLHTVGTDFAAALEADVTLGVSGWDLDAVAAAVRALRPAPGTADSGPVRARVHLKADTGLGRHGCTPERWPAFVARAAELEAAGLVRVEGVFSHLGVADDPERAEETTAQLRRFEEAAAAAAAALGRPLLRHLANTPATLSRPDTHLDMVRVGLGLYGLSPFEGVDAAGLGLRPAMSLGTTLANVKPVPAGQGVSYGFRHVAPAPTTLGLVPLGYADGVPRIAEGARVHVGGRTVPVVGRIAMDQFVVDLGPDARDRPGDAVELFGPASGIPADEWAAAAGTINYELVTRIGARVDRAHEGGEAPDAQEARA
ncbi:alanine racemase [Micrococcus luteus]|nr:alanine racemase [Micrococcus luteus]